jgi:phage head maturation protease
MMADRPTSEVVHEIPGLSFRASFTPSSVNVEKRTADMVWTTGARVKRGFWEPYWEELSLDPSAVRMQRLNNGAPLLAAHDGYDLDAVLGVVVSARLEKGKGTATVRFAKAEDDPAADVVFRKVKDGILCNVSVGYRVHKLEQIEDGRTRDDKTPVLLATDWEPMELSVVPMGADDGAGFRSSSSKTLNPCVVITRSPTAALETRMADPTTPVTPQPAAAAPVVVPSASQQELNAVEGAARAADAQRRTEREATEKVAAERTERAVKEERQRSGDIRHYVGMTDLGDAFAEKMIRDGASVESVKDIALKYLDKRSRGESIDGHVRMQAGDDARDKFIRGACASIFQRSGQTRTIEAAAKDPLFADQFKGISLDPGEFAGAKLRDLARYSLELRGVSVRRMSDDEIVKRALEYRDAGQQGTGDFPILLETAVNKTFLGAYAQTPVSWRRFCGVKPLNDFRASTFYRPGTFSVLDSVSEHGEVQHKNIPDGEKMSITPATKGNIVSLSRRAIVNDDMGVFNDLAGGLGMAAANTIEAAVYALLTANTGTGANYPGDSNPLFYSTRNNIGPTGAMTIATIDGARAIMAKQKDPSAKVYLNLRPAKWVGPVELEGQARVFNTNATDPTVNTFGVTNRVQGLVDDVIGSAYLSAQSTTRHYFFANPAQFAVLAVGFINGREAPEVLSFQTPEYDGVRFRILHDHGEAIMDYRGAVTCAGA